MFQQNEKILWKLSIIQSDLNVVAELTLAYLPKVRPNLCPKVDCSRQVYEVLLRFWNRDALEYVEQFQVMLLSRGNRV